MLKYTYPNKSFSAPRFVNILKLELLIVEQSISKYVLCLTYAKFTYI